MSHKILFIDDSSTTLLLEQMQFIGRPDYNLVLARDGQEAIQKAVHERPRLILMDATPQNMESCREMRKIEHLQRVPILLVSNASEPLQVENGLAHDVNNLQTAPFISKGLFEMVDTYLAGRGRLIR